MSKKTKKSMADEPEQVSRRETETILELMRGCLELNGDVVELGCYRGDTSILLEKRLEEWERRRFGRGSDKDSSLVGDVIKNKRKKLWIYDSFEGLPEKSVEDGSVAGEQFQAGELYVTKREVVERFRRAGLRVPRVKKGFFEDLEDEDLPKQICFGFLDGDLYRSIRTSLELCFPRMVDGGVMVVHDYSNPELPGVTKAVEEFIQKNQSTVRLEVRESLAILRLHFVDRSK